MKSVIRTVKGILFSVASLCSVSGFADQLIPDIANHATETIGQKLTECGLSLIDPTTPGLPYPRRDARYAVVNQHGRALAYFLQVYGNGAEWLWMNPDGSYRHSIRFNNSQIQFTTPWAGNVASANRYVTVGGAGYNFYCRSSLDNGYRPIPGLEPFMQCVHRNFVDVITRQLCRHGLQD